LISDGGEGKLKKGRFGKDTDPGLGLLSSRERIVHPNLSITWISILGLCHRQIPPQAGKPRLPGSKLARKRWTLKWRPPFSVDKSVVG